MNAPSSDPKLSSSPPKEMRPLAVRVSDACRLTGIGRSKLYELIKAGDLQVVKVGAMTLIPVRSLEALLGLTQVEPRSVSSGR